MTRSIAIIGFIFLLTGCAGMSWLSYDSFCCVQQMTIEEVAAHDEEIIHYILRHPELDANILYALRKHEVVREMSKEQVMVVIGPPERL